MKISEIESNLNSTINEAGSFSYGYKKPRKGSLADLAAKKRKEQEKDYVSIEPKDQMVGTVPSNWEIDTSELEKQTTLEATYSYGGAVHTEFNTGDTVQHRGLLGLATVINFSGSSVIVQDSKGKAYKVPASSLSLVNRKNSTPAVQTQLASAVATSQQKTPIGQSIMYNTTKGPVKFTKTNKGWEALIGTAKKLFTTSDKFYNTLEKIWQSQTGSA
jgi:hypothetical protein